MGQLVVAGLGAAAGSLVPGVGWMLGLSIGMTVGGMLFPTPQPEGPHQSRTLQASSYGVAIPIVFGRWRIAGNMVWGNPLHEQASGGGGGKGGGTPSPGGYTYTLDAALLLCEGPVVVRKVWADADLIIDYTSAVSTGWASGTTYGIGDLAKGSNGITYQSTLNANTGNDPTGDTSGTWWAQYHLDGTFASYVTKDMFGFQPGYDSPTAQGQDATQSASMGVANTPAYTNRAVLTVNNFPWSKYGHDPNFTVEVEESVNPTIAYILTKLFNRVGVASGDLDFSAVAGITVEGFMIPSRTDLAGAIKPLQDAFHFDIIEVDGIIKASLRSVAPSFSLDSKWLGVATNGTPPEAPIEVTRMQEYELPIAVDVTFFSSARAYQQASQNIQKITGQSSNEDSLNLPLVMTDTAARQLGDAYLWEKWAQRTAYKTTWPMNYLGIAPGDTGTIIVNGVTQTVRVVDQTMGLPGHIEVSLLSHDPSVYTQVAPGDGYATTNPVNAGSALTVILRDVNAVIDSHVKTSGGQEVVGLYGAVARSGGAFQGAQSSELASAWFNPDGSVVSGSLGGFFSTGAVIEYPRMGTLGAQTGAFAAGTVDIIDTVNTLRVTMTHGAPVSVSDADLMIGKNLAVLGDEILQFRDATMVSTGVYDLSHLIRGKRGTEWATAGHVAGDPFVIVDGNSQHVQLSTVMIARSGASSLRTLEGQYGTPVDITPAITGASAKPYAPTMLAATRPGGSDIALAWTRRSRIAGSNLWQCPNDIFDDGGSPYEVYSIDFKTAGGVLKDTRTVYIKWQSGGYNLASPAFTYTAAMQNAAFGSLQSPISVTIYQMNFDGNVGRGYGASASL